MRSKYEPKITCYDSFIQIEGPVNFDDAEGCEWEGWMMPGLRYRLWNGNITPTILFVLQLSGMCVQEARIKHLLKYFSYSLG